MVAGGKPRFEFLNCIQRILLPLLSIGLTLIIGLVGVVASHAAYLQDIRVGEYGDHTRIVFEFSAATTIERIVPREPGQLTIVFTDTQPQLARKIPIERTQRIKDFKLWYRNEGLSSVLTFAFDHFRYELTNFENPVRIALDVYQLSSAAQQPADSKNQILKTAPPVAIVATDQLPTVVPVLVNAPPSADDTTPTPSAEKKTITPGDDQAAGVSASAPSAESVIHRPKAKPLPLPPTQVEETDSTQSTSTGFSRLQFYLVVGLVTLTIVILALLLLMFVSKQRWADDNTPLNASEFLKKQDERLVALNAQVHEQLKRYDEA